MKWLKRVKVKKWSYEPLEAKIQDQKRIIWTILIITLVIEWLIMLIEWMLMSMCQVKR
jgi:hypothetical protein